MPSPSAAPREWWRDAVFYEVYPRSFADHDGDGEGDLAGVTEHLGALAELGVDALWLTPFYPSPMADGGYDVANYTDVDPRYGTLADFDALLARAHELGLRVTIDLVPNHCSDQHPWFTEAVASGRGSQARERFFFREGRGESGELPPTNWRSVFGGASWTRVSEPDGTPGQWYYHLFAPEQPDLDWTDPRVLADFEGILRFWLDRGVDGFRIDVSDGLDKDFSGGDTPDGSPVIHKDAGSPLHGYYRALRRVMDSYDGDRMAVIETGTTPEEVALLVRRDEMHLAFDLALSRAEWRSGALREAIEEGLTVARLAEAPATWVIENHDIPRAVTRYGTDLALEGEYVPDVSDGAGVDVALGTRRARAAAVLLCALPGALYVYQGQELGLPEVTDLPAERREDPVFLRSGGSSLGRDGCRVPLPWSMAEPPYGFGPEGSEPWLPQPPVFGTLTRQAEAVDPHSMLALYRELLALRRETPAMRCGSLSWLESEDGVLAYELHDGEDRLLVLVNTSRGVRSIDVGQVLAASVPPAELAGGLPPDAAVILRS